MFDPHIETAKKHLSKDKVLKPLIDKYELKDYWGGHPNLFLDLIDIVTGQQLSMKVADVIFKRLLNLYRQPSSVAIGVPGQPTPKMILEIPIETLRSIGLSNAKASYVHNIARAVQEGTLNLEKIVDLSNEEVFQQLTALKGLGPWSAEMFLMFSLKRPDVFSVGDLGVRSAINRLYGIDRGDNSKILALSENWKPYRTYACRYLWASLDNV